MSKARWINTAAVTSPIVLLVAYIGSYFLLGRTHEHTERMVRQYDTVWLAKCFVPAARVERAITGNKIHTSAIIQRSKGIKSEEEYP